MLQGKSTFIGAGRGSINKKYSQNSTYQSQKFNFVDNEESKLINKKFSIIGGRDKKAKQGRSEFEESDKLRSILKNVRHVDHGGDTNKVTQNQDLNILMNYTKQKGKRF
jgi:hypothetical protein